MATCFCGCGESIGLTDRGVNKQGHRTLELLAKLEHINDAVGELDYLHVLDSLIEEGEGYGVEWTGIRHGQVVLPRGEARAFKRQWENWGKRGMMLTAAVQKDADGKSARKGLTRILMLKEAVEKRLDAIDDGEEREAGRSILEGLEPLSRMELPENPEPGFIQRQLVEADLWLAATADPGSWRFAKT
ncbi:MAG: hypothetical protein ACRDMH_00340 [Solirubrobacterales bacterium]